MRRAERGTALLEALVAIVILASAGASMVAVLDHALRDEHGLRARETSLAAAERVLSAMTLLTRIELDRRLGRHEVGEFVVDVRRPRPTLYRIAVSETRAAAVEVLVTVVYRAEASRP